MIISKGVKIFCVACDKYTPLEIEPLQVDEQNGERIWGDIVCPKCHLVICSLSADEPGLYAMVKARELR